MANLAATWATELPDLRTQLKLTNSKEADQILLIVLQDYLSRVLIVRELELVPYTCTHIYIYTPK